MHCIANERENKTKAVKYLQDFYLIKLINVSWGELSINRMVKKVMDNYGLCKVYVMYSQGFSCKL